MSRNEETEDYKEDCPKCEGIGAYTMTNCPDEEPIQCCCDDYDGEEWENVKKQWISDGWDGRR